MVRGRQATSPKPSPCSSPTSSPEMYVWNQYRIPKVNEYCDSVLRTPSYNLSYLQHENFVVNKKKPMWFNHELQFSPSLPLTTSWQVQRCQGWRAGQDDSGHRHLCPLKPAIWGMSLLMVKNCPIWDSFFSTRPILRFWDFSSFMAMNFYFHVISTFTESEAALRWKLRTRPWPNWFWICVIK